MRRQSDVDVCVPVAVLQWATDSAGCDVIAANDIDRRNGVALQNPTTIQNITFLCPIRDMLSMDLPQELFNLDILDRSPPCSTFSIAGSREDACGKEKHFREGQAKQVLSDLFFDDLDLVGHLRPKVAIAGNVKGMILGNAKGYTKLVMNRSFRELGYTPAIVFVECCRLRGSTASRTCFFCALRHDMNGPALVLNPRHRWISAGEATADVQELTLRER
jgi:DNA (cytosine-5)-methyltransferase 1